MKKTNTYILTDHWCRFCGIGRIIQLINSGPTGGGNPVFHCTHCDVSACDMGTDSLCYCGWEREKDFIEYRCQNVKLNTKTLPYPQWILWTKEYNKEVYKRYL